MVAHVTLALAARREVPHDFRPLQMAVRGELFTLPVGEQLLIGGHVVLRAFQYGKGLYNRAPLLADRIETGFAERLALAVYLFVYRQRRRGDVTFHQIAHLVRIAQLPGCKAQFGQGIR